MIKENKVKVINMLMFIITSLSILDESDYIQIPNNINRGISLVLDLLLLIVIVREFKTTKKKLIILAIIASIIMYTTFVTGVFTLMSSFLWFAVCSCLDEKEVIKKTTNIIIFWVILHSFIYIIDVINGKVHVNADFYGRIRYNLGFNTPNASGILMLWWYVGKSYLKKFKIKYTMLYFILILFFYYFNDCRTMIYTALILLILSIILNINKNSKLISKVSLIIIPLIFFITITTGYLYDSNNFIREIDSKYSHRILFSNFAIKEYGPTIFGRKINDENNITVGNYNGKVIMDVLYVSLFYRFGIIYIVILSLLAYYIYRNRTNDEKLLVIIYAIFSMFELYGINFVICFPMIFASKWINTSMKISKKDEREII